MTVFGDGPGWERSLFQAAVVPSSLAAVVCAVVAFVLRGSAGLYGAVLGALLAMFALGLTLYVARRTTALHPVLTMSAALMSYLFTITALLLALVLVGRTTVIDRQATGFAVLVVVLVWLPAQVLAFTRLKLVYVDPSLAAVAPPAAGATSGARSDLDGDG